MVFLYALVFSVGLGFFLSPLHAKEALKSGYKHDSTAPLEITSEQMTIDQKENRVVFKGNVHAIQSKMELSSESMEAFYHAHKDKKNDEEHSPDIYKIEVKGHVRIDTPKEKATGDRGFYLVKEEILELEGHVVLNKEDTVITGDKLVYSAKTGKSAVTSVKDKKDSPRVHAVFVPKKKKPQGKEE